MRLTTSVVMSDATDIAVDVDPWGCPVCGRSPEGANGRGCTAPAAPGLPPCVDLLIPDTTRHVRADVGPAVFDQRPLPAEVRRRTLELAAAGALWAGPQGWALDQGVPAAVNRPDLWIDHEHRGTANIVRMYLQEWLSTGAACPVGQTTPDGHQQLALTADGLALLDAERADRARQHAPLA